MIMMYTENSCATISGTAEDVWEYTHGTESYGNLPKYKPNNFVGKSYARCPYDVECPDLRSTHLLGSVPAKVYHIANDTTYYMKVKYRGRWGYECTYNNCPHYLENNTRYFFS